LTLEEELDAILAADLGAQDDPARLAVIIYNRCYTASIFDSEGMHRLPDGRGSVTHDRNRAASVSDRSGELTSVLEAANRSRASWDEGWKIDQMLGGGRILALKGGAARAFLPGEYLTHRGIGSGPKAGAMVSIFSAPGSAELQPGFYYAFGETVSEFGEDEQMVRFFWNVSVDGAPRLMETLTLVLNRFQVPFRFKCASRASDYPRRDAAVLYLHARYYPIAALVVEAVHAQVSAWLGLGTPLFAKRLADGLAFAEDPDESFGENRSKILAGAMVASRGKLLDERRAAVRRAFEERGLSLDKPWLNPGSVDHYEFPFPVS
jgi:HopA1 effector protein family